MIGEGKDNETPTSTLAVKAKRTGNKLETVEVVENGHLTRVQRRVLEAITATGHDRFTATERIKAACVSQTSYYRTLNDPEFQRIHVEFVRSSVRERVSSLVNASADTAAKVGRDGFNDRRMLLEISGVYVPKQHVEHTGMQPVINLVGINIADV